MTGELGSTPPHDGDSLCDALIQMMSIRSGGRFQVITYSGDDGGAGEKWTTPPLRKLCGRPEAISMEKRALPMRDRSSTTKWNSASCGSSVPSPKVRSPDSGKQSLRSYRQRAAPIAERPSRCSRAVRPVSAPSCRRSLSSGANPHPAAGSAPWAHHGGYTALKPRHPDAPQLARSKKVLDKGRWSLCDLLPVNTAPQSGSGTGTRWSVWPPAGCGRWSEMVRTAGNPPGSSAFPGGCAGWLLYKTEVFS